MLESREGRLLTGGCMPKQEQEQNPNKSETYMLRSREGRFLTGVVHAEPCILHSAHCELNPL